MTRTRWEILGGLAFALSALAIAIADPFGGSNSPEPAPVAAPPTTLVTAPTPVQQPVQRPRIEVVFALDTTGSMGGLLEGAKQKIWSLANQLASGTPRPDIRMSLVLFRDRGDAYVTQATPLSPDLDGIDAALRQAEAGGGGDGPEDVNAALAHAIRQTQWSSDGQVLKLVFLVGDAPPHDDYDGPTSTDLAREAHTRGIIVNTVRCGADPSTLIAWQAIALASGGKHTDIAQDGGVVAVMTPYDERLQVLNAELADTVLGYGTADKREASKAKMLHRRAMSAPAAAAAASYAAKSGRLNDEDLVSAIEGGLGLSEIGADVMPDELRGLSQAEQERKISDLQAKRAKINAAILEISNERDAYVREKTASSPAKDGFDEQVFEIVKEQTGRIGVAY